MPTTLQIQQRLVALGFSPGPLDGLPGRQTTAAIRRFQTARGLVPDGIVGARTLAALFPSEAATEPVQAAAEGMRTSPAGRAAIMQREGVRLHSYDDGTGVLTVGVGHTTAAWPPVVRVGMVISSTECDDILSRDLAKFEAAVLAAVKVPVSQSAFDALVSFCFNVGAGAFNKSSVVKRLNAGDKAGAGDAFLLWSKAGGRTLPGLVTRRRTERAQFLA